MKYTLLLMMFISSAYAQHFSASVARNALSKVITSAIKSYSEDERIPTYVIPASTSHLVLSKDQINDYKIITEIKKYVNIDLSKDFHYYLKWSPMTVEFKLKENDFKFDFKGDSSDFTILAKGIVESMRITGRRFEICETKNKKCIKSNGVYVDIRDFEVNLNEGEVIEALVALNIKNTSELAKVSNTGLYSSFFYPGNKKGRALHNKFNITKKVPRVDISFGRILIPAPTLRVGNREVKLDTSGLRSAIIAQKRALSAQLIHLVGRFITEELAQTVTEEIISDLQEIVKKIRIFNFESDVVVRPIEFKPQTESATDSYRPLVYMKQDETKESVSSELLTMMKELVYYSNVELEYLALRPSNNQSIAFDYDMHMTLNNERLEAKNSILNGKASFKKPNFSSINQEYDVAFALGEPFLNGVLESAVNSGVVAGIFKEKAPVNGLEVKSLNIHFDQNLEKKSNTGTFTLVAGVELDLSKVDSDGVGASIQNYFASKLESDKVWFPLELRFRPAINIVNGRSILSMKFDKKSLGEKAINTYGYPKKDMYSMVEKGILSNIKEELLPALENTIEMDITDYMTFDGLNAKPIGLSFLNSGHIVMRLKIEEIVLKELVDFIGGKE